MTLLQTGP